MVFVSKQAIFFSSKLAVCSSLDFVVYFNGNFIISGFRKRFNGKQKQIGFTVFFDPISFECFIVNSVFWLKKSFAWLN